MRPLVVGRRVSCLALLLLVVLVSSGAPVRACKFTFFPNTVHALGGALQMTTKSVGLVSNQFYTDEQTERKFFQYEFVAEILWPVNPRLCRFLVTRNDVPELFFPEDSIKRFPLNKEHGLPSVRCMISPTEEGVPVDHYPLFVPAGAAIGPNDLVSKHPLCGDLFKFRMGTLLKFSGHLDHGVTRILECQSAKPEHANDYVMVPLWTADCTENPDVPTYADQPTSMTAGHLTAERDTTLAGGTRHTIRETEGGYSGAARGTKDNGAGMLLPPSLQPSMPIVDPGRGTGNQIEDRLTAQLNDMRFG